MKKKINIILGIIILILAAILVYMLIMRQGNSSEPIDNTTPIETSTPEPTPEPTEAPHEHVYIEVITTEATCTTDGLKTLTCECGDTYTEPITATGHVFDEYIYNGDATYFADGTQTAQCKHCEATDTQVALNSKLEESQTEDPQELAAKYLAETLGISIEEARAMLENGGNPVGNGGGSTSNSNGNNTSSSDNGGNTDGPRPGETGRPDMDLGDGGDIVGDAIIGDGTSHNNSSNNGNAFDGWGNNEGNDGGEIVGDAVIGDGTSHNNSSSFEFSESHGDGGEIVGDAVLNP